MGLWFLALKARKAANWPRTQYTGLTVPGSISCADVMVTKSNIIDNVPTVGWIGFPKLFAYVVKDKVDSRIGVVDENVNLAVLIRLDLFKQRFNFVLL